VDDPVLIRDAILFQVTVSSVVTLGPSSAALKRPAFKALDGLED
jgi:hypothetical protein